MSWPDRARSFIGYCLGEPIYRIFSRIPNGRSDSPHTRSHDSPIHTAPWQGGGPFISATSISTAISHGMIASSPPSANSIPTGSSSPAI